MAIGPIPELRPLDMMRSQPGDIELSPVNRVESSARTADNPSRRRQAPPRQPEQTTEDVVELSAEPEASPALPVPAAPSSDPDHQISIFV